MPVNSVHRAPIHPPQAHHLSPLAKEVEQAARGVFPSVLTDAQAKKLATHKPDIYSQGTTKGFVRLTYHLKDAAEAKHLAAALNDGWNGIYENTNECMDGGAMMDLKIKTVGRNLVIEMPFDKNG